LTTSSFGSSLAGGRAPVRAAKLKESVLVVERGRRVGGCLCAEICELATTRPPSDVNAPGGTGRSEVLRKKAAST